MSEVLIPGSYDAEYPPSVSITDLYVTFTSWHRKNFPSLPIPIRMDFLFQMRTHWGPTTKEGLWVGIVLHSVAANQSGRQQWIDAGASAGATNIFSGIPMTSFGAPGSQTLPMERAQVGVQHRYWTVQARVLRTSNSAYTKLHLSVCTQNAR